MKPIVSILIPAYNAESFLPAALNSALAQTLQAIEVLVVDDGSTDRTWQVMADYAGRDRRIVPLRLARQSGPSAARNAALAQARGDWLALLDADDAFLPQRLATLVAEAETRGSDLLADNLLLRDFATGRPLGRALDEDVMAVGGPLTLRQLLGSDMPDLPMRRRLGFVQPVLRRSFLALHGLRYHEDIRSGEDFLLYCECLLRGARFHLTPQALYLCSVRAGALTDDHRLTSHQSVANQRLRHMVGSADPELATMLRQRQHLLHFTQLRESLADRRLAQALRDMRRVPLPLLLARLGGALQRRSLGSAARP